MTLSESERPSSCHQLACTTSWTCLIFSQKLQDSQTSKILRYYKLREGILVSGTISHSEKNCHYLNCVGWSNKEQGRIGWCCHLIPLTDPIPCWLIIHQGIVTCFYIPQAHPRICAWYLENKTSSYYIKDLRHLLKKVANQYIATQFSGHFTGWSKRLLS